mmetsp:Transcript_49224/g.105953  ORF Transcript_49224/g.105953 Transcript_49224/m.105953 type:complete len:232 (+) Transcript_49224:1401-2096(+)
MGMVSEGIGTADVEVVQQLVGASPGGPPGKARLAVSPWGETPNAASYESAAPRIPSRLQVLPSLCPLKWCLLFHSETEMVEGAPELLLLLLVLPPLMVASASYRALTAAAEAWLQALCCLIVEGIFASRHQVKWKTSRGVSHEHWHQDHLIGAPPRKLRQRPETTLVSFHYAPQASASTSCRLHPKPDAIARSGVGGQPSQLLHTRTGLDIQPFQHPLPIRVPQRQSLLFV